MANRVPAAAIGLSGFLFLCLVAYLLVIPGIERDLTLRAEQQLAAASIDQVTVDFSGRDGTVSGPDAGAAQNELDGLRGARWVRADRIATTTTTTEPPTIYADIAINREETAVVLQGTVETDGERQALVRKVSEAGLEPVDELVVDPSVDGSDIGLMTQLVGPVLDGSEDGAIVLDDRAIVLTGAANDPVEAEEIQAVIDDVRVLGLDVEDRMTIVVLSESQQIVALQAEIDQIFELARAIEGKSPSFDTSEGSLSPGAMETLDRVAVAMRRYPLPGADIIGHTDSLDTEEFNQVLSEERATAVRDHLLSRDIDGERLEAIGRGETEPIADNNTEEGRAENRRVDFFVRQRSG